METKITQCMAKKRGIAIQKNFIIEPTKEPPKSNFGLDELEMGTVAERYLRFCLRLQTLQVLPRFLRVFTVVW